MTLRLCRAFLLLAIPLLAGEENFSDWEPTNQAMIAYRWQTDDLSPSACVVQLAGVDPPQLQSVSISYRSRAGFRMIISGPRLMHQRAGRLERTLTGCTRIERVEVRANPAVTTIIAGRVSDEPRFAVGESHAQ